MDSEDKEGVGAMKTLCKGCFVKAKFSPRGICISDPFMDKRERRKQFVYWLEKHNERISLTGELVNVCFFTLDSSETAIKIKEKVYTFPVEKLLVSESNFDPVHYVKRRSKKRKKEAD